MTHMTFDAVNYDRCRRMFIPCFDELYNAAIQVMVDHARVKESTKTEEDGDRPSSFTVLDLGAGTGLLSGMIQRAFPTAELTLVDQQADMLAQAKLRFQQLGQTPKLITADYRDLDWSDSYDYIVSALSLHHLTVAEQEEVYRSIYRALKPDGLFLNLDEVQGETPDVEHRYRQRWVQAVQQLGATDNQVIAAQRHAQQYDHPPTLKHQLTALKKTGFQSVTCWYKNISFVVVTGIRRSTLPQPHQPVLTTERLVLRSFQLSDAADVQRLAGDRIVAANTLSIPHPYPDGAAEAWIQSMPEDIEQGKLAIYAITLRETGKLCGSIGLHVNTDDQLAELGYWIGESYRGQGYCTEAARAILDYGFNALNLNRIQSTHFTDNPASGRVMQKLGMSYEGCRRQHTLKWGDLKDIKLYAILQSDWTNG